jgi:hypothetical protein
MESFDDVTLSKKQRKLFGVDAPRLPLADINCNAPMNYLALQRKDLIKRENALVVTDYTFCLESRRFQKAVDLFIPVAHMMILRELTELLVDPQKLNRDE